MKASLMAACGLVFGFSTLAEAGQVTVKEAHLCCGQCVKLAGEALKDVEGVSGAKCDQEAKTISFSASDDKAAEAGVKALSEAGFFGKASHGDKEVKFPESGAKKGEKADKLTITKIHLCCGQCVKAVEAALKDVSGVEKVEVDKDAGSATISGKGIEQTAAVKALNDEGFFAKLKS